MVTHFANEERMFDKYGFPDAAAHKAQNSEFVARVGELRAYGEDAAGVLLGRGLSCLGESSSDLQADRKGAEWKVILACWIKAQTGVSNRWLSEHIHLGAASGVSRLLQNQRSQAQKRHPLWRELHKCR